MNKLFQTIEKHRNIVRRIHHTVQEMETTSEGYITQEAHDHLKKAGTLIKDQLSTFNSLDLVFENKRPPLKRKRVNNLSERVIASIKPSQIVTISDLINRTGLEYRQVQNVVRRTIESGKLKRVARGYFTLPETTKPMLPTSTDVEMLTPGLRSMYNVIKDTGGWGVSRKELAKRLGKSKNAVSVSAHHLRKKNLIKTNHKGYYVVIK